MKTSIEQLDGYVQNIIDDNVYLRVFNARLKNDVKKMNGNRAWLGRLMDFDLYLWRIPYGSEKELAKIFARLREFEVPFSIGKGWGPADIFEKLREDGLVNGKYKRLNWTGEDKNKVNVEEV